MSNLLDDLTSQDRTKVWSGACAVIQLRDKHELDRLAARLDEIRAQTKGLELGGALFPNAKHLELALRKLEYHRSGEGCLCVLYPEYLLYDPQKEVAAGHVTLEGITRIEDKWIDDYVCQCVACGQRYRVEERESHYTWWGWRAVAE